MRACQRIGAMMLLLFAVMGSAGLAGAVPERIHLEYSAPKICPDESAFVRALRRRTGRFQLVTDAEKARSFSVVIARGRSGLSGRLEIRGAGAESSLRRISGRSCDDVMAALAFMAALAIDPGAGPGAPGATPRAVSLPVTPPGNPANPGSGPRAPEASSTSPVSSSPAPAQAEPFAPGRPPEAPLRRPADQSSSEVRSTATTPSASSVEQWRWSVGAQGAVTQRTSPSPGLGGLLFLEAAEPGSGWWGPVLRAGLFASQGDVALKSGAGARLVWAAAMLEGCPVRLVPDASRIAWYACLTAHVGVMRGQGLHLDEPVHTTDPWVDVGPTVRVRIAISTRLFLEAQGTVLLPLYRMTFEMKDMGPAQAPSTAFSVPLLGAQAGIGVAYQFR